MPLLVTPGRGAFLSIYGEIGDPCVGLDRDQIFAALDSLDPSTPIEVRIFSQGGDAFTGLAVHDRLKRHAGPVSVVVDGLAASAATVIAAAADVGALRVAENALIMVHGASGLTVGTEADHAETARLLGLLNDRFAAIYAERSGQPVEDIRARLAVDTWMTAAEAVAAGFADEIIPALEAAASAAAVPKFKRHATLTAQEVAVSEPAELLDTPGEAAADIDTVELDPAEPNTFEPELVDGCADPADLEVAVAAARAEATAQERRRVAELTALKSIAPHAVVQIDAAIAGDQTASALLADLPPAPAQSQPPARSALQPVAVVEPGPTQFDCATVDGALAWLTANPSAATQYGGANSSAAARVVALASRGLLNKTS